MELTDYFEEILGRYNATPDEWDTYQALKENTRATDPLLEKMAEALERIDQWDWNAILQYSECDKEVFEDLGNVGAALQEYRERKDAK